MKTILKGIFSQRGYAKMKGLTDGRISQMVSNGEVEIVETEDGKKLIKAK